ncbi:MAG: hypothetical protein K0R93_3181 [Anaerosolibacter sp.]|jgi:hypothetical protein|uniref:CC/Se motif family (seleno)protein n=1 Tax=Anaerosolibacter sp. TaxID=1872527 RepID=UPI002602CCB9|nr:CC/Se motif family (seleno)protein [Anaerosolibacter sp.]MDF2548283.1 hypothetical protein [Anaerosolibacter sp.]
MEIKLDEKVKQHLQKKGEKVLTVELEASQSCCVHASIPHVVLGPPKEAYRFDRFEVEGLEVFVYKGAVVKHALKLTLANYLLFKEVEVSGIQII